MRILGIDPGTATTGWTVLEKDKQSIKLISYGVIKTEKGEDLAKRLEKIFDQVAKIAREFKVGELALERVFFNTNAKTALAIGEASGVIKLAAAKAKIPLFEYTPLQVKMALTGYGRAEKKQIGEMVRREFKLKTVPKPDDAADAAAIALTHCYSLRSGLTRKGLNPNKV